MRIIFYLIGLIFLSFGISLTLLSNLGAGGWDALAENLSKISFISVGNWVFIIGITLIILAALFSKKLPDIRVLIVSWATGFLIDFWYYTVLNGIVFDNIFYKLIALAIGILGIGLGCAFIFVTELPKNHTETFVFAVSNRIKVEYKWVKIGADTSALILSLLIGLYLKDFSNIGIGTFINSIFMGLIIDKIFPFVKKIYSNKIELVKNRF